VSGLRVDWKVLLLTALAAFVGSLGQLEFKRGADNLQFDLKLLITNHDLIFAVGLYCISTVLYVYALSKERLFIVYPIIATSYIWTLFLSKIVLKEPVQLTSWAGVFLILLGVSLIATQAGR
jgi:drug/metabolite transporter (DMT)-like permease